jgi:hypothetical protein
VTMRRLIYDATLLVFPAPPQAAAAAAAATSCCCCCCCILVRVLAVHTSAVRPTHSRQCDLTVKSENPRVFTPITVSFETRLRFRCFQGRHQALRLYFVCLWVS